MGCVLSYAVNLFLIFFALALEAIEYIAGTIIRVTMVANASPNITVEASGPQYIALSPPK